MKPDQHKFVNSNSNLPFEEENTEYTNQTEGQTESIQDQSFATKSDTTPTDNIKQNSLQCEVSSYSNNFTEETKTRSLKLQQDSSEVSQ